MFPKNLMMPAVPVEVFILPLWLYHLNDIRVVSHVPFVQVSPACPMLHLTSVLYTMYCV